MSRTGFRLLDPVKSLRQQVDFILQLHDREALLPRERQRRFLMGEGWVAWPGPALADFMRQFIAHNRMLQGGFVIEDRIVTLADIACPVLTFVGEVDEIAPAPAVRAIGRAAPRAEVYELALRAGHFGLVVGSAATRDHLAGGRRVGALALGRGRAAASESGASTADEPEPEAPGVGTRLGRRARARRRRRRRPRALGGRRRRAHVGGARALAEEVDRPAAAARAPRAGSSRRPGSRSACCSTSRRGARRRPSSSSSRTAPTRTKRSSAGSTTSSAACSRSASARASTSAC